MTSHITDMLYSTTCVTRNRQISLFNIMKTATENGACVCGTVLMLAHGALKRLMRILCSLFFLPTHTRILSYRVVCITKQGTS